MATALELSTAAKLGNSSPGYFQKLGSLVSARGVDAITGPTLTRDEMPDGYTHIDPADSLAAFLNGKTVSEYEPEEHGYYDLGSASGGSPATPQQLQYIDAPYAEMYGMDASTAYQEALANTSYQRKVKDLKAAGLNPVLGYSGAGAASFYGSPAVSSSGGVSYGSLGSGKSTASASETATKLQYWLPTLVNGVTNMAFTLGTKNGMTGYAAGTIAQNMVSGALGAIRNHAR